MHMINIKTCGLWAFFFICFKYVLHAKFRKNVVTLKEGQCTNQGTSERKRLRDLMIIHLFK